jgi:hypothetical protein
LQVTYESFKVSKLVHGWLEDGNSARPVIWQHFSNVFMARLVLVFITGVFVARIYRLRRVAENRLVLKVA